MDYIECIGASMALLFLWLEIKERWTMWLVGLVSSSFYIYIFFQSKVYAQMGLNLYFLFLYLYGLYHWRLAPERKEQVLTTTHISAKGITLSVLSTLVLFLLIAWVLASYTNSEVPKSDAFLAALSIVGTVLAARKILECWLVWMQVNTLSVFLYYYLHLYPTAVLYVVYAVSSILGYTQWRKNMYKNKLV